MNLDAQSFLRLTEGAGTLAFFDLEATGLKGDYNSILCVSVKTYKHAPVTFAVRRPGEDRKVVDEASEYLATMDAWVTYYGKGFDFPLINTRLLRWGLPPLLRKPHIDMYYTLKSNLLTARRSQSHLLTWLDTPEKKMSVSAEDWNNVLRDPEHYMPTMKRRCESDTVGLEALYKRTRHLVKEIKS